MVAAASGVKGEGVERIKGSAGAKVVVASKLPMAIELQLCTPRRVQMKSGNNAWVEEVYSKSGPIVTIAGTAYSNGQVPEGMPSRPQMVAGCALTFGVDKEFFERWLADNADQPMVKNRMIFAHEKLDQVRGLAQETVKSLSGLGALTPDNDRRMPKKLTNRPKAPNRDDDEAGLLAEAG
jgi:hypothetical protein